jgi:hypothetical protein
VEEEVGGFVFESVEVVVFGGDDGFDRFFADLLGDLVDALGE